MHEQRQARARRRGAAVGLVALGAAALGVGWAASVNGDGGEADALVPAGPPPTGNAALLVRDGDRVTGSGRIVQVPGEEPELCGTEVFASIGYAPGHEPPPVRCLYGVRLVGVDLTSLEERRAKAGAVEGRGSITGTYRAGVVTVEEQGPPVDTARPTEVDFAVPPCPEPAEGWEPGGGNLDLRAYSAFVAAHPGLATGQPAQASPGGPVLVVLARDQQALAELEQGLRPAYGRNLCVVVARFTAAQVAAARAEVASSMTALRSATSGGARAADWQETARAEVLFVDQAALDLAERHPDGLVVYQPTLRPVG